MRFFFEIHDKSDLGEPKESCVLFRKDVEHTGHTVTGNIELMHYTISEGQEEEPRVVCEVLIEGSDIVDVTKIFEDIAGRIMRIMGVDDVTVRDIHEKIPEYRTSKPLAA